MTGEEREVAKLSAPAMHHCPPYPKQGKGVTLNVKWLIAKQ